MHIGHNNMQSNYIMSNQQLPTTDQQRDLGIIISKDLKWQKQTEKSCKTSNSVLGFIARNFMYKNKELIFPLYKSLLRTHLEHAVQFWSPHLRRDIDKWRRHWEEQQRWFLKSETTLRKKRAIYWLSGWVQHLPSQLAYVSSCFLCSDLTQ